MTHRILLSCVVLVALCFTACSAKKPAESDAKQPAAPVATKPTTAVPKEPKAAAKPFQDEPAAHALYKQMIEAMRKAKSLSYRQPLRDGRGEGL